MSFQGALTSLNECRIPPFLQCVCWVRLKAELEICLMLLSMPLCRKHKSEYDLASDFKELKVQIGILSGIQIGNLT